MKTRIISSLVGLALLAVVYMFLDTLLLNVVMGIVSIIAVYELLCATGLLRFKDLCALSFVLALTIPFVMAGHVYRFVAPVMLVIILGFFIVFLKNNMTMGIEQCAMAFMFCSVIPLFFSCAVFIRDFHGAQLGGLYLMIALFSGWLSDTGAYFVGRRLGKRKLAPKISPQKTVEGSVGGLIVCCALMPVFSAIYAAIWNSRGVNIAVNYLPLCLLTPLFAVTGMLGDLSASAIKRQFGVKDFGSIMPGHGGILDRFDSVLFTLPAVFAAARHIALAKLI